MTIIEIKNLDFAYIGETVLKDVDFTVRPKDFVAIISPNGGGKTTLLKLVLGLLTPAKGIVRVDGKSPQEASPCIGYVPQDVHTNRSFPITAIDVVLMGKLDPKKRCPDDLQPTAAMPWLLSNVWKWQSMPTRKSACFPEANVSGCSSPGHWWPGPSCFCWMNPPPESTQRARRIFTGSY